jgi:hypothetical protein
MITTTLAVVALAGALNASPTTGWRTDYAQALAVAAAENKPMAVLIGRGADRISRMASEGTLSGEAARLLRESYVSVYLDTDTPTGKELASKFALSEGLVISGPGGGTQALRHTGPVNGTELTQDLGQFAKAGTPTTTISRNATPAVITGPVTTTGSASPVFVGGISSPLTPTSGQYTLPSNSFPGFGPTCAPGRR